MMKKERIIRWMTCVLFSILFVGASAQPYDVLIYGRVMNQYSQPMIAQEVWMYSDTTVCEEFHYASYYTDVNGYFVDTVTTECVDLILNIGTHCGNIYYDTTIVFTELNDFAVFTLYLDCDTSNCYAAFGFPSIIKENSAFTFTNFSDNVSNYYWSFGDGTYSVDFEPEHTYPEVGAYNVCLEIFDSASSCYDYYCEDIYVYPDTTGSCVAEFYYADSSAILGNYTISFWDFSSGYPTDWYWDFGDSTFSSEINPDHVYADTGVYTVCLTISDGIDCQDTYCLEVYVGEPAQDCNAYFYHLPPVYNGGAVQFYNQSVNAYNSYWDFGDGTDSYEFQPEHIYNEPGDYVVCLAVSDGYTCFDSYCDTVSVLPADTAICYAYFTFSPVGCDNCMLFSNASSINAVSYFWDFGDDTYSSLENPFHEYYYAGTFPVCLTITTASGCVSQFCTDVYIGVDSMYFNISGQVFAGNYPVDDGQVELHSVYGDAYYLVATSSVDTAFGTYFFYQIPKGEYILKATNKGSSSYHDFAPVYYGTDALFWNDASILNVEQQSFTMDFHLYAMLDHEGDKECYGNIYFNDGGYGSSNYPAHNTELLLFNESMELIDWSASDSSGYYHFGDLANGSYFLYSEITGLPSTPITIILNDDTPSVQTNIIVYPTHTSSGVLENEQTPVIVIGNLYPNPVAQDQISFSLSTAQFVSLHAEIIDVTGRVAGVEKIQTYAIEQIVDLDIAHLPPGVFTIVFTNNSGEIVSSKRFVRQ